MSSDYYVNIVSSGDATRFETNNPSSFTVRLPQALHCPEGSCAAIAEISYYFNHETTQSHAKLYILDWLVLEEVSEEDKRYGKIYEVDLGKSQLPSPLALVSQLNFHLIKHVPRFRGLKIFDYDSATGRVTIEFPPLPYFVSLKLSHQLCVMVGMLERGGGQKGDYAVIGQYKPEGSYKYQGKKRLFTEPCKHEWKSVEQISNYFLYPPHLSVINEMLVYSSITQEVPVNTVNVPLLRCIPLKNEVGRTTSNFGSSLQLIPLRQTTISEITIYLRNWEGQEFKLHDYTRICLLIRPPDRQTR